MKKKTLRPRSRGTAAGRPVRQCRGRRPVALLHCGCRPEAIEKRNLAWLPLNFEDKLIALEAIHKISLLVEDHKIGLHKSVLTFTTSSGFCCANTGNAGTLRMAQTMMTRRMNGQFS
jgi:hypothetical protein